MGPQRVPVRTPTQGCTMPSVEEQEVVKLWRAVRHIFQQIVKVSEREQGQPRSQRLQAAIDTRLATNLMSELMRLYTAASDAFSDAAFNQAVDAVRALVRPPSGNQ